MKYRLQISKDGEYGANYENRSEPDCNDFLNEEKDYSSFEIQNFIDDLIVTMENSSFSSNYKEKISLLKSKENYKVLVIGVGCHGNNEIFLYETQDKEAKEIAHIDQVDEKGSWMNRLYIFDKEPTQITFYNKKLNKTKTVSPEFKDQCFTVICNF